MVAHVGHDVRALCENARERADARAVRHARRARGWPNAQIDQLARRAGEEDVRQARRDLVWLSRWRKSGHVARRQSRTNTLKQVVKRERRRSGTQQHAERGGEDWIVARHLIAFLRMKCLDD